MATGFWDVDGILLFKWLPKGTTINGQYYIKVLEELRESFKRDRRGKLTRRVLLQHDNARQHTTAATGTRHL